MIISHYQQKIPIPNSVIFRPNDETQGKTEVVDLLTYRKDQFSSVFRIFAGKTPDSFQGAEASRFVLYWRGSIFISLSLLGIFSPMLGKVHIVNIVWVTWKGFSSSCLLFTVYGTARARGFKGWSLVGSLLLETRFRKALLNSCILMA